MDTPLAKIVGAKTAKALAVSLDLYTAGDLLYHFPRRYDQRGEHTNIRTLEIGEQVTVMAQVIRTNSRRFKQRQGNLLEVIVGDGLGGQITLTYFNQAWRERDLRPGKWGLFAGKVTEFRGQRQLNGPEYILLDGDDWNEEMEAFAGAHIPVYPAAAKVPTWVIARCVRVVLDTVAMPADPMPSQIRAARKLLDLPTALREIHRPSAKEMLYAARRRLAWDEAFAIQLTLVKRKREAAAWPAKPRPLLENGTLSTFDQSLPFTLTEGQLEVGEQISADLATPHPMHRLLQGEVGAGKAQPLDALVLTPTGFIRMGDAHRGCEVIAADGSVAKVVGVYPQGLREVYRVCLSDGTSVECDADHLWAVNTTVRRDRGNPLKVLSTREIMADLRTSNGSAKWHLPVISAPELECGGVRPIDPYLLGLLLGDGYMKRGQVGFSTADGDLLRALVELLPSGLRIRQSATRRYDWFVVGERRGRNSLLASLRDLGVYGKGSADKFVPESYLVAPIEVRHAVLQGLLDTDGTVDSRHGGGVSMVSASPLLAENVRWLAESLGGTGHLRCVTKMGKSYSAVGLRLPNDYLPFRLSRKAALVRRRTKYHKAVRAIAAIEPVGPKQVQCISIDHDSQLYVTDEFIVTHNTLVALRAMLQVVDAGGQAALLAPTEVLAAQHFRGITKLLPLEEQHRLVLLTGSMGAAAKRRVLADLANGAASMVVGTHALLYEGVDFADLGLIVVDEQHRFGVEQRDALRAKAEQPPHVLVMTATPIPRTVAMTVYGDLEISTLAQLPSGRSPIASHVVPAAEKPAFLDRAWQRLREEVGKGHQAYVVCPRIGSDSAEEDQPPSDADDDRRPPIAVLEVAPLLSEGPLAGLRIGVLHGKLPADEKDSIMRSFAAGKLDVLVATTVIEVGVDVPNATVMVILDADRFGMSQLHQLRGRVGRGSAPGLCLLVTEAFEGTPARERLDAVASTVDGFQLAELDLEQRREGDILGAAQSGRRSHVRLLSLLRDRELIGEAYAEAEALLQRDPLLQAHPLLAEATSRLVSEDRAEYLQKG